MNDKKKILLHGAYNGSNYGDILLAWIIQESIYTEGADVVLNNASPYFEEVMGHNTTEKLKADLNGIDGAVFGGGGYLATRRIGIRAVRLLLMTHLLPMIRLRKRNIPFMVCGVGAGPIHGKLMQKITLSTLQQAQKIIVRNIESVEYLKEYGISKHITVGADLALTFSADLIPEEAIKRAEKDLAEFVDKKLVFIHINLLNPDGEPQNDVQRGCAALVKAITDYAKKMKIQFLLLGMITSRKL
jgi:polysaccharide pyruvyl transferase WcaK-like protein